MKKSNAFERYLQEALRELEKNCEEFDAARCERLLTTCCRVLLEGSDNLGKLVKEHNDKDVEGNSIKRSQDSLGDGNFSLGSSIVLEAEDVKELHGKTLKYSQCRRDHSGVLLPFLVLSSLGSHNCSPCGLPETGRSLHGKEDEFGKAGNSGVQGCCGTERRRVRDEKSTVLLSASHNCSCSFAGNGLDGSCNRVFTACSSVFSPYRPATSRGRNADSPYGWFHSNPPKGELNEKQGKACEDQRLFTVAVEIDSLSGETVQVKADSPEKALAEALQKLTPGVKTVVWGEE